MPPRRQTDPVILAQRTANKRERCKVRVQRHRAKVKGEVSAMLSHALNTDCEPALVPLNEPYSIAARTAQAILKNNLRRYGVTQSKAIQRIAEGLDSTRVVEKGGKVTLLPDTQHRLRASDSALKLLERAGDLPLPDPHPAGSITVNVLVMPGTDSQSAGKDEDT